MSSDFKLDTSGRVDGQVPHLLRLRCQSFDSFILWSDLSPFLQGYTEALCAGIFDPVFWALTPKRAPAFSSLAPEALLRIIDDCNAFVSHPYSALCQYPAAGRGFWSSRQAGTRPEFPPLQAVLNDDGKVCLEEQR